MPDTLHLAERVGGVAAGFLSALLGGRWIWRRRGDGDTRRVRYQALLSELIGDLDNIYAHKSALRNTDDRMEGLVSLFSSLRERADENGDALARLQEADRLKWEPTRALIAKIDERITRSDMQMARLEERSKESAVHVRETTERIERAVTALTQRLERRPAEGL